MSYLNPVTSKNGCVIQSGTLPDGTTGNILSMVNGAGFGYVSFPQSEPYLIRVSSLIDYEISFWLKQPDESNGMELSISSFNKDLFRTNNVDIKTGLVSDYFCKGTDKIIGMSNKWYFCRFILYGTPQLPKIGDQPLTSTATGTNLIMTPFTNNILINIKCSNASGLFLWNFKVKPLRTPFASAGFIQSGNILEIWRKNNNNFYTSDQINRAAQQYLLPYNTSSSIIEL